MLPIIGIGGQAGAGKDTVAGIILKKQRGSVALAQSNPLKWLGYHGFGFTEAQLWGPSQNRNAVDERFATSAGWTEAYCTLFGGEHGYARQWSEMVGIGDANKLEMWFEKLESTFFATKNLSPRVVLQLLGTEYARALNPDIWSELAVKTSFKLLQGGYTYDYRSGLTKKAGAPPASMVVITDLRFPNELIAIKSLGGRVLLVTDGKGTIEATHASEASLSQIPEFWWDAILHNQKKHGLIALEWAVTSALYRLVSQPDVTRTTPFVMDVR